MRWLPNRLLARTSLRWRLTAWNTAVVLVMTVATLLAARLAVRATLYADADAELRAGAREVVLALSDLGSDVDAVVAEMRRRSQSHEKRGWFMQLVQEDGTTIWRSDHCPNEVADFPPHNLDREENVVQVGPYRYVRLRFSTASAPALHVRVGTYTTGLDESLSRLLLPLLAVGGVLLLLTPLAGHWLALRATQPVGDIVAVAHRLSPTSMGDRLAVRGADDELDRLSETINGLLDSVANHVDRQSQFVADAAHELRGPLAAIQSSLEVGMEHDETVDECRDTFAAVLEETRFLAKLSNDLLTLAEAGAASHELAATSVDLTALARRSVDMFAGAAEERGLRMSFEPVEPLAVRGDAGQLRRLIGNLLDNAVRFTPPGGRVDVGVARDRAAPGSAILTVTDTGIGIAPHDIPRLFDRFFKVDPARSHEAGYRSGGLGLPICKAIVTRHGGRILISSGPGAGTRVTVTLPIANPAQTAGDAHSAPPPAVMA